MSRKAEPENRAEGASQRQGLKEWAERIGRRRESKVEPSGSAEETDTDCTARFFKMSARNSERIPGVFIFRAFRIFLSRHPIDNRRCAMPEKQTVDAAKRDLREGKSPTTAAGEFVREEIDHVREGKHGARSAKQAIAIGLSKARRAGIPLKPPNPKTTSESTRRKAVQDAKRGREHPVTSEEGSTKRGRARLQAMKEEPKSTVSHSALSKQAKSAARKRGQ